MDRAGDVDIARKVALASTLSGIALAAIKIAVGWAANSTAVLADGFESAGDVIASSVVLFGLVMAARPPDEEHPYGHGRLETLSGFTVGLLLAAAGVGICLHSMRRIYQPQATPEVYAAAALVLSIVVKSAFAFWKFRAAAISRSAALRADAWNDSVDILSGTVALTALSLTVSDPVGFAMADALGGLAVGFIVIFLGLRVVRDTTLQLMDTMPEPGYFEEIRREAMQVPGTLGVEKCFARKTGLRYHVDLHLDVDPLMTVLESHRIATEVRHRLKSKVAWVADVLVHVEPHGGDATIDTEHGESRDRPPAGRDG